jgi:hypothetical protein
MDDSKKCIKGIPESLDEVQLVYSQTRFIAYPAHYVPDRYFHLASQRED